MGTDFRLSNRVFIPLTTVQEGHIFQLQGSILELQKCVSFFVELETGRCKPEKKAEGKEGVREPNPGDIVEPLCPGMFN